MKLPVTAGIAAVSIAGAFALFASAMGSTDTALPAADSTETAAATVTTTVAGATPTTSHPPTTDPPLHLIGTSAETDPPDAEGLDLALLTQPEQLSDADLDRQMYPWNLPPIAERRAAEELRLAELEEIAAASPPPTTAPPSQAATASVPVNNTATYAGRGGVGYLGSIGSLAVVESAETAPPGTTWDDSRKVLKVDSPDITLDHVYVKGGVDVYGGGTTTITNSIIEFGYVEEMGVLMRSSSGSLVMTDTTIRRLAGSVPSVGNGRGGVQISGGHPMTLRRNDISGLPDGMQLSGNNIIVEWNWIHDLSMVGSYPNNTHNDGIQLYGGTNIRIAHNRIEIGAVQPYSNGALFFQGSGVGNVVIESNYLDGGGYSIRLETGQVSVINNVVGGHYLWGNRLVSASVIEWRDNIDLNAERMAEVGAEITPP